MQKVDIMDIAQSFGIRLLVERNRINNKRTFNRTSTKLITTDPPVGGFIRATDQIRYAHFLRLS